VTGSQCVGYILNSVTTISILTSGRVYNGQRPVTTTVPCINYFEMPGGQRYRGFERVSYSVNCRATTAETAIQLCRLVDELFNGLDGMGIYGDMNGFGITRAFTKQRQGLIPEPEDAIYNAPIDIFLVFSRSTVS
jgi:hypothetical protein